MSNYSIWSIKSDESYKTIEDYDYPEYTLTSFLTNYSRDEIKDLNNGRYFNKIGCNKNVKTPSGCYDIPYYYSRAAKGYRLVRSLFYKYCAHHLFYGKMQEYKTGKTDNFINFAQYLPNVSPLCLDFDIVSNFEKSDRDKFKKGDSIHIYTNDHIIQIVEILHDIIFNNFEVDSEDIKAYVFEKESFKFKSNNVVKDGIHIIYLLPFSLKQRWFIRQELINKLKDINFIESFNFNITNSYEDIVDEAVISRNPWLTYGSVKVESKTVKDSNGNTVYYMSNGEKKKQMKFNRSLPYDLTHIFNYDLIDENIELIYDENTNKIIPRIKTYETIDDIEALLNLFDLDQFSDDDPLEEKSDKLISYVYVDNNRKSKNNQSLDSSFGNNNNQTNYNEIYDSKVDYNYNLNKKVLFDIVNLLKLNSDLYTYKNWNKICCSLYRNSKDCNIPDKDIKDAIFIFCKNDKHFNPEEFDDDYNNIIKQSSKPNYNYSLKYILDCINEINPDKSQKIKSVIFSNLSKDNNLINSFSFNNYKNNSLNIMDFSDFDKKITNTNQLSVIELYDEYENLRYEQHKDDEEKIDIIELKDPKLPFDKTFQTIIYLINKKPSSEKEIINSFCQYIEKYIKYIKLKNIFYLYDIDHKTYTIESKMYLKECIPNEDIVFTYRNKDNDIKPFKINPYKKFLKYAESENWVAEYDSSKPRTYIEIKNINGYKNIKKIFNDGPIIPTYLMDDKPYNDYSPTYKKFVESVFELFKYSLCSNNEKQFEYFKKWIINKTLLKRNKVVVVLQSHAQGIGKSTVVNLFKAMFENDSYVSSSNKCEWLFTRFNSPLKDKVLVGIEEMKKTESKTDWFASYDKLKDLITNDYIDIELKGKDIVTCSSYVDFIITSNNYNNILLESENRRYFIPDVTFTKDDKIKSLTKYVNSIIIGKKNHDIQFDKNERRKYFKCFFAYCRENYDKDFDPEIDIPITDAVITNNDKSMPVLYKYIKIYNLYNKRDLKTIDGKKIFKILFNSLKSELKDFMIMLNNKDRMLKLYNYCQHPINNFIRELGYTNLDINFEINSKTLSKKIKDDFRTDEYVKPIQCSNGKYYGFVIPYDTLLEKYREWGYVNDNEYYKLKDNYDTIDYCNHDYNDTSVYDFSSDIKLKQLTSEIEKLKDIIKDNATTISDYENTIRLEKFNNEQKDKDIDKLKSSISELNTIITKLNTKINELENSNNELNTTNIDLNTKINELEDSINSNSNNKKIKESINPKLNDLLTLYKKCIRNKYAMINQNNKITEFLDSLKTSKKLIRDFNAKPMSMTFDLINKQQQEEKVIEDKFKELLKF